MTDPKKAPPRAEDDHACHDHCLCDHPVEPHEETQDHDLPEATGGVAERSRRRRATRTATGGDV